MRGGALGLLNRPHRGKEAIVATCVSLLSVISMFRFLTAGNETYNVSERIGGEGTNLDFILLGYAALGITIVLYSTLFLCWQASGK